MALFFVWIGELFGADAEVITRAMEAAEDVRPRFDQEATPAPPEFLTLFVSVSLTLLFSLIAISIFYRLAGRLGRHRDDGVREQRGSTAGGGLLDLVRGIGRGIANIHGDDARVPGDPRDAIRHHYRAFQTLLARAGLPRAAAQTPWEYRESLRQPLPGADEPVSTLSDAYMIARYAGPDVPLPDPHRAGESVARVKERLREQDSSG
jgi:hypothetical protein